MKSQILEIAKVSHELERKVHLCMDPAPSLFFSVGADVETRSGVLVYAFSWYYDCSELIYRPYSGKLLREKIFANFAVLWRYAKVFSVKFGAWCPLAWQKRTIRENRTFTNLQKFSPSKVSRYMV